MRNYLFRTRRIRQFSLLYLLVTAVCSSALLASPFAGTNPNLRPYPGSAN